MTAAVSPDLAALAVPIDSVKPYPGNPRRGDVEAIRKSLRRFGQQKPIVVQIGTDLIVAGTTQKPVGMLEEIITRWIPADAVILDPYAGSGSTLIAAENTGRTCLTSELEPAYVQVVIDRWERLTGMQHEPMP